MGFGAFNTVLTWIAASMRAAEKLKLIGKTGYDSAGNIAVSATLLIQLWQNESSIQ